MASERKIQANRANAKRSTGPRTPEGKAVVARNAVTHGLSTARILLDEDLDGYFDHCEEISKALAPIGALEIALAERAARLLWRLGRAERLEYEVLEFGSERVGEGYRPLLLHSGPLNLRANALDLLNIVQRHETAIDRALGRALDRLGKLQSARRGEPDPAGVIDVESD